MPSLPDEENGLPLSDTLLTWIAGADLRLPAKALTTGAGLPACQGHSLATRCLLDRALHMKASGMSDDGIIANLTQLTTDSRELFALRQGAARTAASVRGLADELVAGTYRPSWMAAIADAMPPPGAA